MSPHRSRLGVDIVELKKARKFYDRHKERLATYFSGQEIAYVNKGQKKYQRLALVMAAKEAVFKALNAPALTPMEVFNNIEIIPLKNKTFTFRLATPWRRIIKNNSGVKLKFYKKKHFVIAICYLEFSR